MTERKKVLVFCERIDNESFCESVVRELAAHYDVRAFGPGWPRLEVSEYDREDAHFYLELDSASGKFYRPTELEKIQAPKFAWFVDTHKKPDFHRAISRDMDVTFYAMKNWGGVLEGNTAWLPLHCDSRIFYPIERERDFDVVFVGSYGWRAEPVLRIAKKHGLRTHVECTTGPLEKTKTAEIYSRTKLVFNRHVANDLNFRVFEATACGRVLLTDAQWNGQYELFDDQVHFVLYTDERDLEEKILKYVRDDEARVAIERQAAEHAARCHTTRARVAQLRDAIEAYLRDERRNGASPQVIEALPLTPAEPSAPSADPRPSRRWLVYAGEAPKTITNRSYGEELAYALAARGDDVFLARSRRGELPPLVTEARAGEPHVLELDQGLVLQAQHESFLASAAALHARFERLARQHEVDGVIGEGPLGALVAQPVAARRRLPFVLALEECEVLRRKNRLTREQLYRAEVEEWAVERAALVLAASEATADGVKRFYQAKSVMAAALTTKPAVNAGDTGRLLERLGLRQLGFRERGYTALLARDLNDRDAAKLLRSVEKPALALTPDGIWRKETSGRVARLGRGPATGAVLGALVLGAEVVLAMDPLDRRAHEAALLGCRVHGLPAPQASTADLGALDAIFARTENLELVHGIQ